MYMRVLLRVKNLINYVLNNDQYRFKSLVKPL
jgi:hypothetical protein